jgi:hypothetical protein
MQCTKRSSARPSRLYPAMMKAVPMNRLRDRRAGALVIPLTSQKRGILRYVRHIEPERAARRRPAVPATPQQPTPEIWMILHATSPVPPLSRNPTSPLSLDTDQARKAQYRLKTAARSGASGGARLLMCPVPNRQDPRHTPAGPLPMGTLIRTSNVQTTHIPKLRSVGSTCTKGSGRSLPL